MRSILVVLLGCWLFAGSTQAAVSVVDDAGRRVVLDSPAQRIVSLAPHVTELLFDAGAGDKVVATVRYSNFPEQAKSIPRIGDSSRIDMERLLVLKPDLVVAWHSSLPQATLSRLLELGMTVYVTEPRELDAIAEDLVELGQLAGTRETAHAAARSYRAELERLRRRYSDKEPLRVFYQLWPQPLMTVNGDHFISHVVRLCGGRNIFAALETLSPAVAVEAVLAADPRVIIAARDVASDEDVFARWHRWKTLTAVRQDNLFDVPADVIHRPTPRLLGGARRICSALESVRRGTGNVDE